MLRHRSTFPLREVRDRFLSDGYLDPDLAQIVRPDIFASWRRSQMWGASAGVEALPFESEVNAEGSLYRAAEPVLARLGEKLYGLGAGVLLSDRNARIIQRWAPDPAILRRMDLIASQSGSSGSEQHIGTNGIGTIIEDRQPHMVVGAEHFAEVLTSFTCVGAPIFHPMSRRFEGVVTLNADVTAASPLLTSLIASTAQEIESRLLEISSRRERALLDAYMVANRAGRVVAVVSDDVLLAGSRAATQLKELDQALLWQQVRDAIEVRGGRPGTIVLRSLEQAVSTLTCTPVLLDGHPIGAIIEVVEAPVITRASPAQPPAVEWRSGSDRLVGHSAAWGIVISKAAAVRDGNEPLLITGESGVGKMSLVRAMAGTRPVHVIDCLAAPANEEWTELRQIPGDLPPETVVVFRHLDALCTAAASVLSVVLDLVADSRAGPRLVATARPVEDWVVDDISRRLVDQLGVVSILVPPLRDRREDIADLTLELGRRHAAGSAPRLTTSAMQALGRAPWPGNVRQLSSVIRNLVNAHVIGEVTADRLPYGLAAYSSGRNLTKMEQLELDAILNTIDRAKGNKVETARLLGISRSTLYRKMRRYRIDPERTFY